MNNAECDDVKQNEFEQTAVGFELTRRSGLLRRRLLNRLIRGNSLIFHYEIPSFQVAFLLL